MEFTKVVGGTIFGFFMLVSVAMFMLNGSRLYRWFPLVGVVLMALIFFDKARRKK